MHHINPYQYAEYEEYAEYDQYDESLRIPTNPGGLRTGSGGEGRKCRGKGRKRGKTQEQHKKTGKQASF